MFPDLDYGARLDRARSAMTDQGIDVLLVSVGADLPYLAGYEATPLERVTMLVVPATGPATLVVPRLEAARVAPRNDAFEILPWDETDDPLHRIADLVGSAELVAIGEQTWATFLLGLQDRLEARFVGAASVTRPLREIKTPEEIDLLRQAGAAADRVAGRLLDAQFAGRSEADVARDIGDMLIEEGHDTASFAIVASGPNAASPHHEAGTRTIQEGDTLVLDFGGRLSGYCSDTTRSFVVGDPSSEVAEAFAVLREAQDVAASAVRPGVPAHEIDRAARRVIDEAGYGEFFIHRTGHGIGLEVHEYPYIVETNDQVLEPGMAFSVEPGIYVPERFGMRIEDIVVVTDDGVERLNRSDRDLGVVG